MPLIEDLTGLVKLNFNIKLQYDKVIKHELEVMQVLNWDLHRSTVFSFIENYAIQGLAFTSDKVNKQDKK